jgi:hypothetical protein
MRRDEPERPLISCVLPTYNRRRFLPHAIRYFVRQDYSNKELVIVDDGSDAVEDLVPAHPLIRYVRLPQKITLGSKLNLSCVEARGAIIAQWDDDDWYGADRLSLQLEAMLRTNAEVCGISDLLYYDIGRGTGHRYVYPPQQRPWLLGSSLFFRRELWERNRFAEIDIGMDALFVWAASPERVCSLPNPRFAVHLIHQSNVSPKSPQGPWWSDHPVSDIADAMGDDWQFYRPGGEFMSSPRPGPSLENVAGVAASGVHLEVVRPTELVVAKPPGNVYACLVHEARDCVIDLCRNLRHFDPESTILLYNGGNDPALLAPDPAFDRAGIVVHPNPRPMRWGSLHEFALDCMRFALSDHPFETLTIVDSDQLALRPGWTAHLRTRLGEEGAGVGLLGSAPERLLPQTDNAAAITAWHEIELWRPFLRRFPDGESKFVHWTFWPSTVFTADAARELVRIFDHDQQLQQILRESRLWVTEEIVFPTLTALLGFRIARRPGSDDYVRYRQAYTQTDLDRALSLSDAYWIHPIPRRHDDPLRSALRERHRHYEPEPASAAAAAPVSFMASAQQPPAGSDERPVAVDEIRPSVLAEMRRVPGWLGDDEADLLITMTDRALTACPDVRAVVEVGSFRGKGTTVLGGVVRAMRPTARVWAIDPHDGVVGAIDRGLQHEGPTLESFRQNMARAGLEGFVETVQARAADVAWSEPICLLLIDGLHDYAHVAGDFHRFEPFLVGSALAVFHDYADYYPGVRGFVDELIHGGRYLLVAKASSLIVLKKVAQAASVSVSEAAAREPSLALVG